MDKLLARIPALLAPHAAGLLVRRLVPALPGTGATVLDDALARLRARDVIIERGKQYLIPRPDEDQARADNEAQLASQLAELLAARWPDAAKPSRS